MGRTTPGESITSRLGARATGSLSMRRMADGGEVYTGGLAQQALESVGARAMTMDGSIFVNPTFDVSRAEDAALYAHERHHQSESGGDGGDRAGQHDMEERHAIGIEQMVFQRIEQGGEDPATVLADARMGIAANHAMGGENATKENKISQLVSRAIIGGTKDRDPMEAYHSLRLDGWQHKAIVDGLKDHVVEGIIRQQEEHAIRNGGETDFVGDL